MKSHFRVWELSISLPNITRTLSDFSLASPNEAWQGEFENEERIDTGY
jgi:hypothetical protein